MADIASMAEMGSPPPEQGHVPSPGRDHAQADRSARTLPDRNHQFRAARMAGDGPEREGELPMLGAPDRRGGRLGQGRRRRGRHQQDPILAQMTGHRPTQG